MADEQGAFVGKEITVLETGEGGDPVRFRWRDVEHRVVEVLHRWQDWGFSPVAHKKDFKSRRHRNYYEVRTDRGFHGLVYVDRGVKPANPKTWILYEIYEL